MRNQQGFTLLEVLIAIFIAGIAILGLVMLELTILRSSQSAFNYTIATIETNTLADKVWRNLCQIDGSVDPNPTIYTDIYTQWQDSLIRMNGATSSGLTTLELSDRITVNWTDKNFDSSENDHITLHVLYPDLSEGCK